MDSSLVVVAIDYGTVHLGYTLLPKGSKEFYSCYIDGTNERIPNIVLLNSQNEVDYLGESAQKKYISLLQNGTGDNWSLFEGYKTSLHKPKLTRDLKIADVRGNTKSALLIFGKTIKFLKHKAEISIRNVMSGVESQNIKWIITIPALWSDCAKQFMREAAISAGIAQNRLMLVLEPEAASLFCLDKPVNVVQNPDHSAMNVCLHPGQKYILADIGGGTTDICIHEVLAGHKLREIYRSTGDIKGGININNEFTQLLMKLIGSHAWCKFKNESPEYFELMSEFETKKRQFSIPIELMENVTLYKRDEFSCRVAFNAQKADLPDTRDFDIAIRLPYDLRNIIQTESKTTFDDIIKASDYRNCLRFFKDKLIMKPVVMLELFESTLQSILHHLRSLYQQMKYEHQDINIIFLVGGFSESNYVQERVKLEINSLGTKAIFPGNGSLAVLKGAAMMGFTPRCIAERRAGYTYGFGTAEPFKSGVHPESLKIVHDGKTRCGNVFYKMISKGQVLKYGQKGFFLAHDTFTQKELKHKVVTTKIYRSNKYDPKYCIPEEECECVGKIIAKPPSTGWPEKVNFENHLIVGEAEFVVKVINKQTALASPMSNQAEPCEQL
ncbi:heat shock 70 kDa protein 12A-like [Mercenaria mercenaria]|uniref:heat shock 70 kDa protein 12A-like n=1 Tax=Mercenaria mercenaria TaxID=6596 RepID=UPI00234F3544|nr:heat shock 70 kDa protein 12A-like [Mercenaria mercenaria]